jgi:hypothetical protein
MAWRLLTQAGRYTVKHWRAPVRHLVWTGFAEAATPILLLWAFVAWRNDSGPGPGLADLVGRGELYLVAVVLFIAALKDALGARRLAPGMGTEVLILSLFVLSIFCVLAWSTLVGDAIDSEPLSDSHEQLATTWGIVACATAAAFGMVTALLADENGS